MFIYQPNTINFFFPSFCIEILERRFMAHQDLSNRDKVATLCETRAGRSSDVPVRPRGGEWSVANGWQRSLLVLMREPEGEKKKKKK